MISPCIKKCWMENGYCLGCKRSLDEITDWSMYSNKEREYIMEELETRNLDELSSPNQNDFIFTKK